MFMPGTSHYADYEFGTFDQEKFFQSSPNSHLLDKLRTIFKKITILLRLSIILVHRYVQAVWYICSSHYMSI
jgi:hypothetical protein